MKIRALKAITIRDDSGKLTSIAHGAVAEVSSELGNDLISDGLAEEYTLVSPSGSISITKDSIIDVTQYAYVDVDVDDFESLVDRSITVVTEKMLSGITSIGKCAFEWCQSLTSVTIPSEITSINDSAFAFCTNLENVTIKGNTSIGDTVFNSCTGLSSLTMLSTTPPSAGNAVFINGTVPTIYVPAESVDTYKAASVWSNWADKIQAIQE